MQLEKFIQFVVHNNALIIQGLVGGIVLLVLFLAYRSFVAAKDTEIHGAAHLGGGASLGELEEALKKILEKANAVPQASAVAGANPEQGALLEKIDSLKRELEVKQVELEQAKAVAPAAGASADPAAGAGMSSEEKSALESQLKELQARLSEYEIISEDIADLSFYKEENAKLKKEMDSLKQGGASAAPAAAAPAPVAATPVAVVEPPPPPAPEPAPAPEPKAEPEIVGKSKATDEAPAAVPEVVVDDDIMKEFEAAVAAQKSGGLAAPEPAKAAPQPEVVAAAPDPEVVAETASDQGAPAAGPAGQSSIDDLLAEAQADLMAEMATPTPTPEPSPAPAVVAESAAAATPESGLDLGSMDMDKMVAEAMGLDGVESSDSAVSALEVEMDPNKLAEEAASLQAVKPEDAALMGDFENFVKKEKGES